MQCSWYLQWAHKILYSHVTNAVDSFCWNCYRQKKSLTTHWLGFILKHYQNNGNYYFEHRGLRVACCVYCFVSHKCRKNTVILSCHFVDSYKTHKFLMKGNQLLARGWVWSYQFSIHTWWKSAVMVYYSKHVIRNMPCICYLNGMVIFSMCSSSQTFYLQCVGIPTFLILFPTWNVHPFM